MTYPACLGPGLPRLYLHPAEGAKLHKPKSLPQNLQKTRRGLRKCKLEMRTPLVG